MHQPICCGLVGFLVFTAAFADAGVVVEHQGMNDPLTEGFVNWTYNGGGSSQGIANDQGLPAWSVTSTAPGYYQRLYDAEINATPLLTQGFTLTLRARVDSGPVYDSPYWLSSGGVVLGLGSTRMDLELGSDGHGNTIAVLANQITIWSNGTFGTESLANQTVTLSGLGYHTYQLYYDLSLHTSSLYVDGRIVLSGYAPHVSQAGGARVLWGALNNGTFNTNLVRLETGNTLSLAPEPSTLASLAVGVALGLGLIARRSNPRL